MSRPRVNVRAGARDTHFRGSCRPNAAGGIDFRQAVDLAQAKSSDQPESDESESKQKEKEINGAMLEPLAPLLLCKIY